jgi:hypothetical protein
MSTDGFDVMSVAGAAAATAAPRCIDRDLITLRFKTFQMVS